MSNKMYDILKFVAQIVLPALSVFYIGLCKYWNFPYPEEISGTIMLVDALLGALLGLSSMEYYKKGKDVAGTITLNPEDETAQFDFADMTVADLLNMKVARVKVDSYDGQH